MAMCVCAILTGFVRGSDLPREVEGRMREPGPVGESTHEETVESMRQMVANAQDSYARMCESAGEEHAQLVREIRDQYERRLTELAEMDFASMTDDEIVPYMLEVSNIITAIREARDVIAGLG